MCCEVLNLVEIVMSSETRQKCNFGFILMNLSISINDTFSILVDFITRDLFIDEIGF